MEYEEFREQYEQQHPASVPVLEAELSPYPHWLRWATLLMFVCSALLSGVHTVPVVRDGIPDSVPVRIADAVSLTAFVSVELAIFVAAYALVGGAGLLIIGVLVLSTGTALVANVYSVVHAYQGGDIWTLLVAVIIGLAAPGIALLSGKMFVDMHRASRSIARRARDAHREASIAWDDRVKRAWNSYQKHAVPKSSQNRPKTVPDAQNRTVPENDAAASERVVSYLKNNPEASQMSIRDIANALNVGHSTVHRIKRSMGQENGHHHD